MKSHQVLMEEKIKDVVYIRGGKGEEEEVEGKDSV